MRTHDGTGGGAAGRGGTHRAHARFLSERQAAFAAGDTERGMRTLCARSRVYAVRRGTSWRIPAERLSLFLGLVPCPDRDAGARA